MRSISVIGGDFEIQSSTPQNHKYRLGEFRFLLILQSKNKHRKSHTTQNKKIIHLIMKIPYVPTDRSLPHVTLLECPNRSEGLDLVFRIK